MQLSNGKNTISDARFKAAEDKMFERQDDEYELVHNGSGRSEEMPSELARRHNMEHNNLLEDRHNLSVAQWLQLYPDVTVTDERMEREAATAAEHSRWTGEPLGETAGIVQSGGISQSH
jgi:hypothetical protein